MKLNKKMVGTSMIILLFVLITITIFALSTEAINSPINSGNSSSFIEKIISGIHEHNLGIDNHEIDFTPRDSKGNPAHSKIGVWGAAVRKLISKEDVENNFKRKTTSTYELENNLTVQFPADHCFDEVKNFDEKGVDCGGEGCYYCTQARITGQASAVDKLNRNSTRLMIPFLLLLVGVVAIVWGQRGSKSRNCKRKEQNSTNNKLRQEKKDVWSGEFNKHNKFGSIHYKPKPWKPKRASREKTKSQKKQSLIFKNSRFEQKSVVDEFFSDMNKVFSISSTQSTGAHIKSRINNKVSKHRTSNPIRKSRKQISEQSMSAELKHAWHPNKKKNAVARKTQHTRRVATETAKDFELLSNVKSLRTFLQKKEIKKKDIETATHQLEDKTSRERKKIIRALKFLYGFKVNGGKSEIYKLPKQISKKYIDKNKTLKHQIKKYGEKHIKKIVSKAVSQKNIKTRAVVNKDKTREKTKKTHKANGANKSDAMSGMFGKDNMVGFVMPTSEASRKR